MYVKKRHHRASREKCSPIRRENREYVVRWRGRTERHRQLCRMEEHASVSGTKRERYILRSVAKKFPREPFHAIRFTAGSFLRQIRMHKRVFEAQRKSKKLAKCRDSRIQSLDKTLSARSVLIRDGDPKSC